MNEPEQLSFAGKISSNIGGLIASTIMVVNWVAYAEIMQTFKDGGFNHLYFIRYCSGSGYMLCIIPWYFVNRHSLRKIKDKKNTESKQNLTKNQPDSFASQSLAEAAYSIPSTSSKTKTENDKIININNTYNSIEKQMPLSQFIKNIFFASLIVTASSYFCEYLWYISLNHTTVAVNNTIFQTQCVWVFLFSSCFLGTKITILKMFAVLIAIGGTMLVSFGSDNGSDHIHTTSFGIIICIIASILFGIQGVSTGYVGDKYFRKDMDLADNLMLISLMGITIVFTMWPGFFILDATGIETFSLPSTKEGVLSSVAPVILELIFIASFFTGITLSGPVLMSMGAMATIPLGFAADAWLHGIKITWMAIGGSFLIFISFALIELPIEKILSCKKKSEKN